MSAIETELPASPERTLEGKVFILTGANRGIGAAIAIELGRRGAIIIGPHRESTPKKNARALATMVEVEKMGGTMISPIVDLTKSEDRASLIRLIKGEYGRVDGIIYNHAGGMEKEFQDYPEYPNKVNATSKLEFFQEAEAAGILGDNVVVLDEPSNWSLFYHAGIEQMDVYSPIAQSKKLGAQLLRDATRAYNYRNRKTGRYAKFGQVCSHGVDKTTTMQVLAMVDRDRVEAVAATAEGGYLHSIAETALAVADMAEGLFEDEEIVFVGSRQIRPLEMPGVLPMYDHTTRYVRQMVFPGGSTAFGFHTVRKQDALPHFSKDNGLRYLDVDRASLTVTPEHTGGHFTSEFGVSVLPGIEQIAVAAEVGQFNFYERQLPKLRPLRLAGIAGPVEFRIPVLPGDELLIEIINPEAATLDGTDVLVKIGSLETASVKGLKFEEKNNPFDPEGMTLARLIEAGAQTLGLAYIRGRNIKEALPLLTGIAGPIEYQREALIGERLEMEAIIRGADGRQCRGDIVFWIDDKEIARAAGYSFIVAPTRTIPRVTSSMRRGLK